MLTIARGLQDSPEFISIYDINFIFFSSALGWAPAQIGNFTACYGFTQILSGKLASWTLPALGGRRFTTLSNLATVLAWALWGRARTMPAVAIALLVSLPCHRRMEAVHAYLVRHATKGDGGMGKGEAESCISNCPSLATMFP